MSVSPDTRAPASAILAPVPRVAGGRWAPAGPAAGSGEAGRPRGGVRPEEWLMAAFGLVLAVVTVSAGVVPVTLGQTLTSPGLLGTLLIGGLLVFVVAYQRAGGPYRWDVTRLHSASFRLTDTLRGFVVPLACMASYATLHDVTPVIRPDLFDSWLIAFDQAVFRVDVSRWMNDHLGAPWLTAVMTICYLTYGSAQAAYALSRYFRGRTREFHDFSLAVGITGVIGYSGYLLVPAVGPHIYQTALFPEPLPGHVGAIGAILDGITAVQGAGRDVFPSLHTAMTVVLLICTWRDARRWFWGNLPVALGLIMSTMYLRKHYAIDVLAGVLVAVLAVALARRINRWWYRGAAPRAAWPVRPSATGGTRTGSGAGHEPDPHLDREGEPAQAAPIR